MEKIICPKCGSNNYKTEQRGIHQTAICASCNTYIKHLPQGKPAKLYFGKYKDRDIDSMTSKEEIDYLLWMTRKMDIKPNSLREAIVKHLNENDNG